MPANVKINALRSHSSGHRTLPQDDYGSIPVCTLLIIVISHTNEYFRYEQCKRAAYSLQHVIVEQHINDWPNVVITCLYVALTAKLALFGTSTKLMKVDVSVVAVLRIAVFTLILMPGCCYYKQRWCSSFIIRTGCSFWCIKPGHKMISANSSSSTKISMMNLPMYSIWIIEIEIEGQVRWGLWWICAGECILSTCIGKQKLALLGPAVCSQPNHDL